MFTVKDADDLSKLNKGKDTTSLNLLDCQFRTVNVALRQNGDGKRRSDASFDSVDSLLSVSSFHSTRSKLSTITEEVANRVVCVLSAGAEYVFVCDSESQRDQWSTALRKQKNRAIQQKLGHLDYSASDVVINRIGDSLREQKETREKRKLLTKANAPTYLLA